MEFPGKCWQKPTLFGQAGDGTLERAKKILGTAERVVAGFDQNLGELLWCFCADDQLTESDMFFVLVMA